MKKVLIFNTSICSRNIGGDSIIMEAVQNELYNIFPDSMFFHTITHDKVWKKTYRLNKDSDYSFIGGTNLLSSNMHVYNQWKINLIDSVFLKNIILMGVGWWQYQNKPNLYTKILLNKVLSKTQLHSVRDSYTEKMLRSIGIANVINTSCPTMWKLTKEHCAKVPKTKAKEVVFTLTDYNKDVEKDKKLINILLNNYQTVYFWPQGDGDIEYIKTITDSNKINILGPSLRNYNFLLEDKNIDIDYVGTRLHAGIRALQKKRRTIIIAIDNRSEEKSKDFNLKVLNRRNLDQIENIINEDFITNININQENINIWKKQFIKNRNIK